MSTSPEVNVSVVPNQLPTVSFTSPANGSTFSNCTTITINASAVDGDGRVAKVDFYDGTQLLTTERKLPYSYQWTKAIAGSHTLTAVVTDNCGAHTTSSAVTIKRFNRVAGIYVG